MGPRGSQSVPVRVVRTLARAQLRQRRVATLVLVLFVGFGGGVVLAAVAGASRTDSAMNRFVTYNKPVDVAVVVNDPAVRPKIVTHGGGAVMVIGHPHADSVAVLRETEPGVFEPGNEPAAFPMRVVVSVPEPGRIRHSWWYGRPGDIAVERDVSDVTLQP
jgi:hypothetical protein